MPPANADFQTVLFLCYLTNLVLSALIAGLGRRHPGAWLWVSAQALLTLGALTDTFAPELPPWMPLVLGNTAYVGASVLFSHSVWVFRFHQPFPRLLYAVVVVQLVSFALAWNQVYWVRAVVFAGWMTVGPLFTGILLLRVVGRFQLTHVLTAIPFLMLGVGSLVRVVLLALTDPLNIGELGAINVWYISGAILLGIVILFGYFMMNAARAEQEAISKDEAIETRNRELVESSRAKDLFFSIIAHDLRGPIGGAARYTRKHLLGKMTGLEAKYTEVETLASALEKTNDFLEKLLWWSKAQLHDWQPTRAPLDLEPIFAQALGLIRPAADLKEISLELAPAPYPEPIADSESVQLILGNLLSNAVKFSRPGRRVKLFTDEENGLCRITVQDEGAGMDTATIDRLFRIEDKLSTHGTTGERGSGMGLLLAQSLAERNGGGITMDSVPGEGTRATVWLPTPNLG